MQQTPKISWDRLAELRSEIGEEDFAEVVELFLAEFEEALVRLSSQAAELDLGNEYHALKGCAVNLGMSELAEHCAAAESGAKAGAPPPDIAVIADIFHRSRACLDAPPA